MAARGEHWRSCVVCCRTHPKSAFSAFQWNEGRIAKCKFCTQGQSQLRDEQARGRASYRAALFEHGASVPKQIMDAPDEQSALRWSVSGHFPDGNPCTVRWYRDAVLSYEDAGNLPVQLGDRKQLGFKELASSMRRAYGDQVAALCAHLQQGGRVEGRVVVGRRRHTKKLIHLWRGLIAPPRASRSEGALCRGFGDSLSAYYLHGQ